MGQGGTCAQSFDKMYEKGLTNGRMCDIMGLVMGEGATCTLSFD